MADVVIDASAALAEIHREPGQDVVRASAAGSAMSAVNFAEVISHLTRLGVPREQAAFMLERLGFEVLDADKPRAADAGALHGRVRASGISLGDGFCLALARELGLPVVTADRRWATLDLDVEIRFVR
jgi:ribonuclease VapC